MYCVFYLAPRGCVTLKGFSKLLSTASWGALDGSLPVVALIGRPNVGKSALFNRLVKKQDAMVFDTVGSHVTRDYKAGLASLSDLKFTVVDTSGFEPEMSLDTIQARATRLTSQLINKADIALLLLDSRQGLSPIDEEVAAWLRRHCSYVHVIPIANKAEGISGRARPQILSTMSECLKLGFGDPIGVSAASGEGMADLYGALQPHIDLFYKSKTESRSEEIEQTVSESAVVDEDEEIKDKNLKMAIMGMTNVGKSTLMNQLLGQDRCLIGPEPGLTRDVVRDGIFYEGCSIEVVDTAGWLRRTRFDQFDECNGKLTFVSQHKAKEAMNFTHVVVLVVDAAAAMGKDVVMLRRELSLAGEVLEQGRSLVVVFNKMDALSRSDQALVKQQGPEMVAKILHEMDGLPCLCISAKTGQGCEKLLPMVIDLYKKWNKRVSTPNLNRWMRDVDLQTKLPGLASGGSEKVKFLAQTKTRPPTFTLHVSSKKQLRKTDLRTLTRSLRKSFDFDGVPVRLVMTEKPKRSYPMKGGAHSFDKRSTRQSLEMR